MENKKKGPGRPRSAFRTRLISARVREDIAELLTGLAGIDRRSTSAQLAIAAEFYVAKHAGRLDEVKK